jgi:hypothetical protein
MDERSDAKQDPVLQEDEMESNLHTSYSSRVPAVVEHTLSSSCLALEHINEQ